MIEEYYGASYFDVCITNIVKNLTFPKILPANSRATNIRYITLGERIFKRHRVLSLLEKLCKDASAAKTHGITLHVDLRIYIFCEEDIRLTIHAAYALIQNDQEPAFSLAKSLYRHGRALFDGFPVCHLEQGLEKFPTFALFIETKLQQIKLISYSIMPLFITTMRPFD